MAQPQNVRIVHPDGTRTEVELTHIGEVDGSDLWEIPAHYPINLAAGDSVEMDELPAMTSVQYGGQANA